MRTLKNTAYQSYVSEGSGQDRFSMYTGSPSIMVQPLVSQSPPPWDGSAEGYGPEQWDYGLYYRQQAPMSGFGADEVVASGTRLPETEIVGNTWKTVLIPGLLLAGVGLWYVMSRKKKKRRNRPPTLNQMLKEIDRTGRLPRGSY